MPLETSTRGSQHGWMIGQTQIVVGAQVLELALPMRAGECAPIGARRSLARLSGVFATIAHPDCRETPGQVATAWFVSGQG